MHIKRRGTRAMLYRSTWVKKGTAEGNTHGYSRQTFVGSIPTDAIAVPEEIRSRISSDELAFVHRELIAPARAAADTARQAEEHKQRDPVWRLDEAARLAREAAALSADAHVPQGRVKAVADALTGVKVLGAVARPDVPRSDPLADALQALRAATRAVKEGRYGHAPEEGVRRSKVYLNWLEITREVEGTGGENGLLRALQRSGWVKAKNM